MKRFSILLALLLVGCGSHGITGKWVPDANKNAAAIASAPPEVQKAYSGNLKSATLDFDSEGSDFVVTSWPGFGYRNPVKSIEKSGEKVILELGEMGGDMKWTFTVSGQTMTAGLPDGRIFHYIKE